MTPVVVVSLRLFPICFAKAENDTDDCERRAALLHESCVRRQRRVRVASYLLAMARACATKRSLSSWTSYKKGLVDSGKSCGVLVVSHLIAYAGVFTQTSSVKPNPFANVTIKIDVIFTFIHMRKQCIPGLPPAIEGLGTRLASSEL